MKYYLNEIPEPFLVVYLALLKRRKGFEPVKTEVVTEVCNRWLYHFSKTSKIKTLEQMEKLELIQKINHQYYRILDIHKEEAKKVIYDPLGIC